MDRVIIDTNLWISFLLTKDFTKLDQLLRNRTLVLLFSQELIDEFLEVARRPKFKKYFSFDDLDELLLSITKYAEFITVTSNISVCRDSKDNFLLALAKDGKATHLLSGDKDLLELEKLDETAILSISDYLSQK